MVISFKVLRSLVLCNRAAAGPARNHRIKDGVDGPIHEARMAPIRTSPVRSSVTPSWTAIAVGAGILAWLAGSGLAQDIPPAQVGGKVAAPVEIIAVVEGDRTRCEPAEARLPAEGEIDLRIINRSDLPVTVGSARLLADQNLVRHEGDAVHVAGNTGYQVKAKGLGRIVVRTPGPGRYEFTCASSRHQGEPFRGVLELVPKAQ